MWIVRLALRLGERRRGTVGARHERRARQGALGEHRRREPRRDGEARQHLTRSRQVMTRRSSILLAFLGTAGCMVGPMNTRMKAGMASRRKEDWQ